MPKLTNSKFLRTLSIVAFCLYIWLLVWVILLKCNLIAPITDNYYKFGHYTWPEKWQLAKESFVALFETNEWGKMYFDVRQDTLNIVIFVPFGMYVAYFAKKCKLLWAVALSLLTSACFELLQLTTMIGFFGAIDLVTNTLGGLIGWLVCKIIYKDMPTRTVILNVTSIVAIISMLYIAIHAVVGTIKIWDVYVDVLKGIY